MSLSEYKDIFGKPNTGLHKYRVANIAVVDVVFTVLGAYAISSFFNFSFIIVLIVLLISGIYLHHLFGVKTTVDKLIFD